MHHLLARSPLGRLNQEAAEAAAFFVKALDGGYKVVGSADAPCAVFGHHVDNLVAVLVAVDIEVELVSQRLHEIVVLVTSRVHARLLDCLFLALGEMHVHDYAPFVAIHRVAVLGSRLFRNLPEVREVCGDAVTTCYAH